MSSRMPLYHGPTVDIKIGSATYNVSNTILCAQSPYFAAMLSGNFKEAEDQSAELNEIAGVVSNRSFELVLQLLYIGQVNRGAESPPSWISSMIEFARLADMLGISNVGSCAANSIRKAISANPPKSSFAKHYTKNIHLITSVHVEEANHLPQGHPVRKLLAQAVVDAFLSEDTFKFSHQLQTLPFFAADVINEVKAAISSSFIKNGRSYYKDPFSGKELVLRC